MCPLHWPDVCPPRHIGKACAKAKLDMARADAALAQYFRTRYWQAREAIERDWLRRSRELRAA